MNPSKAKAWTKRRWGGVALPSSPGRMTTIQAIAGFHLLTGTKCYKANEH